MELVTEHTHTHTHKGTVIYTVEKREVSFVTTDKYQFQRRM